MRPSLPRLLGRALLSLGLGAALVAGGGPALAAPAGDPPLVVHTEAGAVRGTLEEDHRLFQGIPFAAPPVGDLRFRAPAPVEPWDGVRDATERGSMCPQLQNEFNPFMSTDEDCLSLNVTTPAGLEGRRGELPVMVWIHGGGWISGAGSLYDARTLALDGDAVVVTVNYRLGPLGFLAQRDLSAQNGDVASGSAALLDQQAALRWVERNIAAFGGDPDTVTVFGESAGASSVCVQLTSPTARGLFDRAIAQSFSCTARYDDLATAEATGDQVAAAVGCAGGTDVVACLREVGVEELLRAWPGGAFVVGGSALPVQPADAIAAGEHARVPVVHGNNRDEATLFTPLTPLVSTGAPPSSTLTAEEYVTELTARHGDRAGEVLARYPADAQHAVELPYLFPGLFGAPLTPEQEELSATMVRYWTTFAATGDPNGRGVPTWHRYRDSGDVQGLDLASAGGVGPVDVAAEANCAFWASLART